MRVTELAKVSPEFRSYRKAKSLLNSMEKRMHWYEENSEQMLTKVEGLHWNRYSEVQRELIAYIARLDKNEFISHTPKWLGMSVADCLNGWVFEGLRVPGPAVHDGFMRMLVEQMNEKGRAKRAAEHAFALVCEVAQRCRDGWYMVFNTLTVGPGYYMRVFHPASVAFKEYIRSVDRACARAFCGSVRAARQSGEPYHTYFAVVEAGAEFGRLHIHVLHFMRRLPEEARDPNFGRVEPSRREVSCFRRYWSFGWSTPIAVRYSTKDAYGIRGWRWPFDVETGKGLEAGSPLKVAGYVCKYIMKSYASDKRSNYLWRVRKSQRLGQALLRKLLLPLSLRSLLLVASDPTLSVRLNNKRVPPGKLREAAISLSLHLSSTNPCILGRALVTAPSPLQLLRASTPVIGNRNSLSCISSVIGLMPDAATYEEWIEDANAELQAAGRELDQEYFRRSVDANASPSTRVVV